MLMMLAFLVDQTQELCCPLFQAVRRKLLSAHPHLSAFMDHADAEVIQIEIKSFLLLDGLTQASFEDLSDSVS